MANSKIRDTDKGYRNIIRELLGLNAKKKKIAKIGVFSDKKNRKGQTIAEYATKNEFGSGNIPERSFMRSTYDEKINETRKMINKFITRNFLRNNGGRLLEKGLSVGAAFMSAQIKLKISNSKNWAKPNSPVTIALKSKKGRIKNTPLIDSGALRNSITWRVE
jgi:hypothetical protein